MIKDLLKILDQIIHIAEIIYEYLNSIVIGLAKSAGISGKYNSVLGSIMKSTANISARHVIFTTFIAASSYAVVSNGVEVTSIHHDPIMGNSQMNNSSFNNTTGNMTVVCPNCNGTGTMDGGTGSGDPSSLNYVESVWVECDNCVGTGQIESDNETVNCPTCHGAGGYYKQIETPPETPTTVCPVCNGTGYIYVNGYANGSDLDG